ncbi:sensor histidine kinase [Actinorugispora endophytica]|uniref:histidine kinase n=1 Tax=Actinorugispora endophytica TaxID=1605990 RepID=A0A4R6UGU0_9ACTN|nr:histidine kinase [Actinorugispora endophytica]TDQ44165.1 histidine kinase [Actinorugispora endophytica]
MTTVIRRALAPLHQPRTYTRWAYLILGGAAFVPYLMATLVILFLLIYQGGPIGPTAPATEPTTTDTIGLTASLLTALTLIAATALVPGTRAFVAHTTATLLGGPLQDHPPSSEGGRARTAGWLVVHLTLGFTVCLLTMVTLSEAALLILAPLTGWGAADPDRQGLIAPLMTDEAIPRWGPLVGTAETLTLLYLVAGLGAALARLAPRLLGPSPAERLAAAQARADSLAERNRLARELHDSIGHALSVVALQAGAAERVIDADPAFARTALAAIADTARTATAELDHVLGLLREDRAPAAPPRTLADLDALVDATRAAGARVDARLTGDPARVPGVVSRETYRVCQEALTNALRHAHGAPVTLTVRVDTEHLSVHAANPLPAAPRRRTRGGRGLAGMGERVHLLGGTLDAGPHDGHWRLAAHITWKGHRACPQSPSSTTRP